MSGKGPGFKVSKSGGDFCSQFYAVSVRYPDELYIPPEEEAKEAYNIAKEVKEFILQKISPRNT